MSMVDLIKQIGVGAVEAGQPVAVVYGTVTKTSPLEVTVEQRLALPEAFLLVPESLTRYEQTVGSTTIVIRPGLKQGDRVVLLRMQGGQQYLILDKVVTGGG
ncbi:DUF2577 domain-containing protein [Gorillibacterium sp. sgz500922]|uniref:DUF2577 domain-containing protein n=1 Tax=Gorillibacterium sp. sgz500922 TaxID=3446694 RepID=UPI003F676972